MEHNLKLSAAGVFVAVMVLGTVPATAQLPNAKQLMDASIQVSFGAEVARKCQLVDQPLTLAASHRAKLRMAEMSSLVPRNDRPKLIEALDTAAKEGAGIDCKAVGTAQQKAIVSAVTSWAYEMIGLGLKLADGSYNGLIWIDESVRVASYEKLRTLAAGRPEIIAYGKRMETFLESMTKASCSAMNVVAMMGTVRCAILPRPFTAGPLEQAAAADFFLRVSQFLTAFKA